MGMGDEQTKCHLHYARCLVRYRSGGLPVGVVISNWPRAGTGIRVGAVRDKRYVNGAGDVRHGDTRLRLWGSTRQRDHQ